MSKIINVTPQTLDLGITGVEVQKNALIIADDVTRSGLEKIGTFLGSVEGSRQWWHGDYVNALRRFRGEHYGAAEAALAMGIDEGTLRNAVSTSAFYPPAARVDGLSWTHHAEAQAGAGGDLAVAQGFLDHAATEKLSVRDLREYIRTQNDKAAAADTGTKPGADVVDLEAESAGDPGAPAIGYSDLKRANAWARCVIDEKKKFDADTAGEILSAMEDLLTLSHRLQQIVAVDAEAAA